MSGEKTTRLPLDELSLDAHVEDAIMERANLRHLYDIEQGEGGPEAVMKSRAAASIWRRVQEAITEAGWKVCKQ